MTNKKTDDDDAKVVKAPKDDQDDVGELDAPGQLMQVPPPPPPLPLRE